MTKMIITIEKGLIYNVISTEPIEMTILDFDNKQNGEELDFDTREQDVLLSKKEFDLHKDQLEGISNVCKKLDQKLFTYATYKFYDGKGRRLSIFCDEGQITVIPCSRNDVFNKKIAKELYSQGISGNIYNVQCANQNEFIDWCRKHYKQIKNIYIPVDMTGKTVYNTILFDENEIDD